ncbi:MAG: hypothetical protein VW991_03195, partial [Aquiluna sp.]
MGLRDFFKRDSEIYTSAEISFDPDTSVDFESQVSSWKSALSESSKVRDFDQESSKFFSKEAIAAARAQKRERTAQQKASGSKAKKLPNK